jgi:oleandomycin transport system ATP-binding protein
VVGGQTLTVRPADPERLADAEAIVSELSGGAKADHPARGTVAVPVSGDDVLAEAVLRLRDADIAVTELSLRLPSLDEVFFTLTDRRRQETLA